MPTPKKMTPEAWARCEQLRNAGATFTSIAAELGVHYSTLVKGLPLYVQAERNMHDPKADRLKQLIIAQLTGQWAADGPAGAHFLRPSELRAIEHAVRRLMGIAADVATRRMQQAG